MNKRKKSHTIKGVRIIEKNQKNQEGKTFIDKSLTDEDKKFIDKIYKASGFKEI